METIDVTRCLNKIPLYVDFTKRNPDYATTAFKLQDRVPLKALDFSWLKRRMNNNDPLSCIYPHGVNFDFVNNNYLFDKHCDINSKVVAYVSYITMKFMHEYGFLSYEVSSKRQNYFNTEDDICFDNYLCFYKENTLVGFGEIPLDTYITLLHLFNSSGYDGIVGGDHPYITEEDCNKTIIPLSDINFVFDSSVFGNNKKNPKDYILEYYFNYHYNQPEQLKSIKKSVNKTDIIIVDDLYHYVTGRQIKHKQQDKLFTYE